MANKSTIDYDVEEVMDFCRNTAPTSVYDLQRNLNKLTKALDRAQDRFHCKGGDSSNAVMKIYKGFSNAVGSYSSGAETGKGIGGLVAGAASIINVSYNEAANDKQIQENDYNIRL